MAAVMLQCCILTCIKSYKLVFTFLEYPLHVEESYDPEYFPDAEPDDLLGILFMGKYPNATYSGILCEKGNTYFL